jgi:hypothetical protein
MRTMKGQSATEQLITYGWAGMIIVVILGVLVYLGVFSINNSPDRCIFQNGLFCKSHRVYAESNNNLTVNIEIMNKFTKRISVTGILCSSESPNPSTGYPDRGFAPVTGVVINPEYSYQFKITCYKRDGTFSAYAGNFEGLVYVRYRETDDVGYGGLAGDRMKIANLFGRIN